MPASPVSTVYGMQRAYNVYLLAHV